MFNDDYSIIFSHLEVDERNECNAKSLYWLLGSSVQKQALRDGERSSSPACKHRRVGVQSEVVTSILMLERRLLSRDGEASSMGRVFTSLRRLKDGCLDALSSRFARWTKPLRTSLPLATLTDLGRSKSELIAENALLRQQLIILKRQVKRPPFTRTDRMLLVLLARLVRTWQQALLIVQPDTLLRWHRELFRLYWKRKSKAPSHTAEGRRRNDRLDQRDGDGQSTLGC